MLKSQSRTGVLLLALLLQACASTSSGEDDHLSNNVISVGVTDGTVLYDDNTSQVPKGLYRDFPELFANSYYHETRARVYEMTVTKMVSCFEPAWETLPEAFRKKNDEAARGERRFHLSWSDQFEDALKDADRAGKC